MAYLLGFNNNIRCIEMELQDTQGDRDYCLITT